MSLKVRDLIYRRYKKELRGYVDEERDLLITKFFVHFPFNSLGIHGLNHVYQVLKNGLTLAEETGADKSVVILFAVFHDCARDWDGPDHAHGARGAIVAEKLRHNGFYELDEDRLEKLVYACKYHTDGFVSSDPTIGTCWDADRLDLVRVGITPAPFKMSTQAAKEKCNYGYHG